MRFVAGVDEVGRGPLAGAVVAAAVILDPKKHIEGLADSKKLSEKKRNELNIEIREKALCWALGRAEVDEIDDINILQASLLAMKRAVEGLSILPDHVKIDGNKGIDMDISMETIIKGDSKVASISAASIIAKVARDKEMTELDLLHPEYGFARHKGYPTKQHREALIKYGALIEHRKSFKPVKEALECRVQQN
ncbi:ribonuclease HII [Cocleimonas sp. KMM 6892]|uniref:ribonuclease HII n=1 Tax=unclassified Cocleimonas TaxID=2639732 RepID=UPI002DBEA0BF|nr:MULTISPECIES: ribonuclease HII [unclassified Cocleimonas]MEB8431012.1 ribonuclease HII [Cocleimonas sp. KMM 6892]MEC4714216.1 ribonuclease HII [Cocleimonas sp. KMM 6895]MEC4743547.1 ribonuclease HII [Cocleimonas sp. KMM 6896]